MRGHIIWFCLEIRKIIIKCSLLSRALVEVLHYSFLCDGDGDVRQAILYADKL